MKVAIIGCGLIGRKRALALGDDDLLVGCSDTDIKIAQDFASFFNCFRKDSSAGICHL